MDVPYTAVARLRHQSPALLALLLWLALYGPAAGHGFVKDDFVWIARSRLDTQAWTTLWNAPTGFFRPVVSVSFALNYALAGLEPFWFGQTNVLLAVSCIGALSWLLTGMGVGPGAAAIAAFAWGFNVHGISFAILWISGRTSLLSTLAVTLAAGAWVRHRRAWAIVCAAMGMLAKEDAFVVPALLTVWSAIDSSGAVRSRVRVALTRTWPVWAVTAGCLMLLARSGAYTPSSAPAFYSYRFDHGLLATNGLEYLDRSATTMALVMAALWLLAGRPRVTLTGPRVRLIGCGAAWWAIALLPTVLLPVRSSLYALLPAVGVAIAAAAAADAFLERSAGPVRARVSTGLLVLALIASPIYILRNRRLVREAELSSAVIAELRRLPSVTGTVVLHDDRAGRPFAEQAFGSLAGDAARLVSDGRLDLWIAPPPAELSMQPCARSLAHRRRAVRVERPGSAHPVAVSLRSFEAAAGKSSRRHSA